MRIICCLLLGFCSMVNAFAQEKIDWAILQDVRFDYKQDEQLDAFLLAPTFGEKVKAYEGVEVEISGFTIPLDVASSEYVLSGVTMNSCFFCGRAGPESVIELELSDIPRAFETDEYLTFKGILVLNERDVARLTYILKSAELVD